MNDPVFERVLSAIQSDKDASPADARKLNRRAAALQLHYPEKINRLKRDMLVARNQLIAATKKRDKFEKRLMSDITFERDETTNKPKYCNADLRKIELDRRLDSNAETKALIKKIDTLTRNMEGLDLLLDRAKADHWALINLFQVVYHGK